MSMNARVAASERTEPPASPVAARWTPPSWRDRRLVLGLVLVLGSTVVGARLLGAESSGTPVWAARHDLPAGAQVRLSDLESHPVTLGSAAARYVSARTPLPPDLVLAHAIGQGELIPVTAVAADPARANRRTVTIPVERFHAAEDLARGDRVDVYVSSVASTGEAAVEPVLLAAAAQVVDVEDPDSGFGGTGGTRGVVVAVDTAATAALVGGLGRGSIDLVRVPIETP